MSRQTQATEPIKPKLGTTDYVIKPSYLLYLVEIG